MARASVVSSSLPSPEDEIVDDEIIDGEDVDAEMTEDDRLAAEEQAIEDDARRQGWRPLAEYKGKPGGWVDAKTFIARGQNYLPFVQKELRETKDTNVRMAAEMESLRTETAATRADMQKLLEFSRKANQAGYDRAVKELKAQQRAAVEAGDTVTYDKIEGQLGEMAEAREEVEEAPPADRVVPPPNPKPAVKIDAEYQEFLNQNPWVTSDRVLNAAMIEEHNRIIKESPGLSLYDQLEQAKEAVMAEFPKKFGRTEEAPNGAPAPRAPRGPLGPTGRRPQAPAGRTGIDAIVDPQERATARQGYASAKRSMPNLTEKEYLEIFNNPHGDVLEVINNNKRK